MTDCPALRTSSAISKTTTNILKRETKKKGVTHPRLSVTNLVTQAPLGQLLSYNLMGSPLLDQLKFPSMASDYHQSTDSLHKTLLCYPQRVLLDSVLQNILVLIHYPKGISYKRLEVL